MPHEPLHCPDCGSYMRTRPVLAGLAPRIVALRRSGVTVRGIAASLGASRSGVQGLLARLGLTGERPPRTRRPVLLSRKARAAIGLLTHPLARRLTWRERVVLQALVRGQTAQALAAEDGIGASALSERLHAARRRLARPWRRRSRARRPAPLDPATWAALTEGF
jgi:hypothetical protein